MQENDSTTPNEAQVDETQPVVDPQSSPESTVHIVPKPLIATPAAPIASTSHNSPGLLVLQWLTYAFWGWTVLALAWLTVMSVNYFIDTSAGSGYLDGMIAYSLAAVIVLFVISLVCDIFYARQEPEHKTGAAMVIMIIHTVLFALFGIGSLIVAVFAIVRMLIGDSAYGDNSGPLSTLISFIIVAIVYGMTLIRTLNPKWFKRAALVYWVFMIVVVVIVTALGIAGPAAQARFTRDDRLISDNLGQVSTAINDYANSQTALPKSLNDIKGDLKGDAKLLLTKNLVDYKPLGMSDNISKVTTPATDAPTDQPRLYTFEYDLCVTYKAESDYYSSYDYTTPTSGQRDTSPSTYAHKKGKVCYELATRYQSSNY